MKKLRELKIIINIIPENNEIKVIIPKNTTLIDIEKAVYSLVNYTKVNYLIDNHEFRCFVEAIELCMFSDDEELDNILEKLKN